MCIYYVHIVSLLAIAMQCNCVQSCLVSCGFAGGIYNCLKCQSSVSKFCQVKFWQNDVGLIVDEEANKYIDATEQLRGGAQCGSKHVTCSHHNHPCAIVM